MYKVAQSAQQKKKERKKRKAEKGLAIQESKLFWHKSIAGVIIAWIFFHLWLDFWYNLDLQLLQFYPAWSVHTEAFAPHENARKV